VKEFDLDLIQLIIIIKKRFLWITAFFLLCGAIGYIATTLFVKPLYTATATMYVYSDVDRTNQSITSSEITASQQLLNTYLVVLKSDTVLDQVAKKLGLNYSASTIRSMMTAGAINDTEAFEVTVTHHDPAMAQKIVNTIIDVAPDQIVRVVKAGGVEVIDYAKLPTSPSSPNKTKIAAISAVLGLFLSTGFVLLLIMLDTKIHDTDDLVEEFDYPVLGSIPTLDLKNKNLFRNE
jgi:capsular polysaccharide biosynthesis protein